MDQVRRSLYWPVSRHAHGVHAGLSECPKTKGSGSQYFRLDSSSPVDPIPNCFNLCGAFLHEKFSLHCRANPTRSRLATTPSGLVEHSVIVRMATMFYGGYLVSGLYHHASNAAASRTCLPLLRSPPTAHVQRCTGLDRVDHPHPLRTLDAPVARCPGSCKPASPSTFPGSRTAWGT
ncbi:hypothetical protein BD413DRAFT_131886 [Trametes elegans]|nr:hypothetical protein BD413DRAFT_131886 [Trametes elegans]